MKKLNIVQMEEKYEQCNTMNFVVFLFSVSTLIVEF